MKKETIAKRICKNFLTKKGRKSNTRNAKISCQYRRELSY